MVQTYRRSRLSFIAVLIYLPKSIVGFLVFGAHRNLQGNSPDSLSALLSVKTDCKDGFLTVPRTFVPSPKKGQEGLDIDTTFSKATMSGDFSLAYKIFRPMTLSSQQACPILVLHGGPSVPSDYLFPLVDVVPYRSIIFFDQLGCGRSDSPEHVDA